MGLDAGRVLKRSVLCPHCHEERLFTLRAIVEETVRQAIDRQLLLKGRQRILAFQVPATSCPIKDSG
jgi:hypothetical protein